MSRFLFRRALRTRPRLPRPRRLRIDSLEDRTVPSLTLTLADPAILEGTKTVGTLTRTGDLSQPLTVTLDSSDHSEVNIPGSITILAGKSSISFGVFGIDDTEADGAQDVNLLAWVDGEPGTAYATVKVYDNDSTPLVQPDSYNVVEDETLTDYGYGVLGNDYSSNGELTATLVSGPSHGTVTVSPGGGFTYTPFPNYNGTDSFIYQATDPAGFSGQAKVTITVWEMNDPLELHVPGPQTTAEEVPITFCAANGNAITVADVDSPRLMVNLLASGGSGILTLQSTEGLEFPNPNSVNNSFEITFYADSPAEATAALEGLVFTPAANYNGTFNFDVIVQDASSPGYPGYASEWVPITVTPVNDVPVAVDDVGETWEDSTTLSGPAVYGVLANDSDADELPGSNTLTAVLVSGPSHGTVTLNPNGTFTYLSDLNYNGTDSFTYRASDGVSLSNVATVTLTIHPVDDWVEVEVPGPQTTVEEVPITFSTATGNAITIVDPESPRVKVSLLANGATGILTLPSTAGLEFPYPEEVNNTFAITFYADSPAEANAALDGLVLTPAVNYADTIHLWVEVWDETYPNSMISDMDVVQIAVTPVDDPPVAYDNAYDANEDVPLTVYGLEVLADDYDPDGDPLTAILVSGPSHGTLILNPVGDFTYTPAPNYFGTDSFTYQAWDGTSLSNVATVTLTVHPVDDPVQVTGPGAQTTAEDTPLVFSAAAGNAITVTDVENPPVMVSLVVQNGILTLPSTAGLEFPDPISPNNSPSVTFYADDPAEASAALAGLAFTPNADFNGSTNLTVTVRDLTITSPPVTASTSVPITITAVNDAPVAVNDGPYTVEGGETISTITPSGPSYGVLANDSDVDGDSLSAVLVTGPSHGTLTFLGNGDWSYTADPAYSGTDTFTYQASDGQLLSNLATVTFTVTPRNLEPVGAEDAYSASEDTTLSMAAPGVLGNDSDPEGQPLTAQLLTGPAHGTLTLNGDGSFSYTPSLNYNGPDEFWYRAFDGVRYSEPTRVALTVNPTNDAPSPAGDSYSLNEDGLLTVPAAGVLANDTDIDGDPLSSFVMIGPAHGDLALNADGSFTYRPFGNYNGTDSFTYAATDPTGAWGVADVTITVNAVNDAPVNTVPSPQTLVEDTTLTFSAATGNAIRLTDVDAGSSVIELRLVANGFLTFPTTAGLTFVTGFNGGNVITVRGTLADLNAALEGLVFRPGANFTGTFSLQITTNDLGNTGSGGAKSDTDFVTLNITPVNDAPQNVVPLITPVTPEDTPLTFNPPIWVTDPDQTTGAANAPVKVTLEFAAGGGTLGVTPGTGVTLTGNGTGQVVLVGTISDVNAVLKTLVFTPLANANDLTSPVQIRMTTDDQANGGPGALTDTDVFAVSVTPVNDPPVAADNIYEAIEDQTLSVIGVGVLGNDSDPENDPLTAVLVTGPSHGTVTLDPGGSFTYTPDANYFGTDSFTYRAADATSQSNVATVTLIVAGMDDPIDVTAPATGTTAEDTPVVFSAATGTAITVTDPESTRVFVEMGAYGIITLKDTTGLEFPFPEYTNNAASIYFYAPSAAAATAALEGLTVTPPADYSGKATLTVFVRDDSITTYSVYDWSETYITVTAVNDAPVAVADGPYTVEAGEPLVTTTGGGGAAIGVLANDTDVDGDSLSAVLVDAPSHGTLTFNSDGSFTYTAETTYSGTDTFTYRASDGQVQSGPATVTIQVTPRNLPPVTVADAYSVDEDGKLSVAAPGMLANDADPEGQPLTAQVWTGPAHGTLSLSSTGGFTYTPAANYNGPDEFWYRAFDGTKYSEPTRVALTVNPVNDSPVAAGESYALDEDVPLTITAPGLLANDTDADGDKLSAALVTGPAHGSVTVNADGSFTYTPDANYAGADSFTYRASDPSGAGSVATVGLTVRAVNDAPVAADDAYAGAEDAAISLVVSGTTSVSMTSDKGDYIGQGLTYNLTPATGTFTISRNYDNGVSLAYTSNSQSEWWYWDFAAPDEGLLMPGTYSDAMRFPFQSAGHPGMDVSGNGRGSNTLTGWFRIDDIAYGPNGEVLVFAATFEQHSEGATPALRGTVRYNAGGTATGGVLLNDADAEGSPLTATLVQGPQHGQLVFNPNGTFMYVPGANFYGVDSFQYKAWDGTQYGNVATVTLTVNGVNDAPVNTVPGTQTIVEDTPLTFSVATGNAIRVSDADAGTSPIEVRLSASGSMTLSTTAGLTFVSGSNGDSLFTVRGTVADLNAALDGLVFRPAANTNGSRYVQITTNDLGNTGSGGALSDMDLAMVNITPVNDAPENVVPLVAPVTAEDTPLTFNPPIQVTDPDQATGAATAPVRVTLEFAAGGGTLTVTPAPGATVTGNGTGQVVLVGMIQSINNTLRTLMFTPLPNANDQTAPVQIRMTTDDQANGGPGALTDTDVFAVSVTPVNDAPTTSGLAPVVVLEDAAPTAVALTGSFADIEDGGSGLTYSVAGNTNPGLFGSLSVADGVLTVNYAPDANGTATLTVRATDSGGLWVETPLAVTVTPVNDAPTFTPGADVTVASDAGPQTVAGWAAISAGAANESGQALTIEVSTDSPLLFAVQPSIDPATGTLNFTPVAGASGTATVTVVLHDDGGTADGGVDASTPVTFTITLNPPAGTPGVQVVGTTLIVTGGTGADSVTISVAGGGNGSNGLKVTGTVNGQPVNKTFKQAFTDIRVSTDGGNDTVSIADAVTIPIVVDVGAGDDSVKAGGGNDLIFGGLGNDTITGGAGDDNIDAGAGNDSVSAGQGRDLVFGQAGDDTLLGGDGNDFLIGGLGADQVFGQNGDDIVVAGTVTVRNPSSDSLRQVLTDWGPAVPGIYASLRARLAVTDDPASVDRLEGDAQTDWFWSADPADVLDIVAGEERN